MSAIIALAACSASWRRGSCSRARALSSLSKTTSVYTWLGSFWSCITSVRTSPDPGCSAARICLSSSAVSLCGFIRILMSCAHISHPFLTGSDSAGVEVEHQLGRGESLFQGDAMDLADMVAEPAIERLNRGPQDGERGGEVVGLQVDHSNIPAWRGLDPDRFPDDAGTAPGVLVGLLARTRPARGQRDPDRFGLAGQQGKGESN